jgi:pre-mRNA-splicing factor RBM22/SLT11
MIRCAFVNFKERSVAELAAQAWANGLEIDNERVGVKWGRSKTGSTSASNPPVLVDIAVTA